MKKSENIAKFSVQLLSEDDLKVELGEAFSSIFVSPAVTWTKFVLTDSQPNANNQRVPKEEFPNLINTGKFMPIKMAQGEIADGHDAAAPLGVMTHLKEEGETVVALAALWSRERPADIEYIKTLLSNGAPVNVSWEILYGDYSLTEAGIMDLKDVTLRAATIVGMPAYQGRTPVLAIAAKKWSKAFLESLPNESFLYIDRLGQRHFAYKDENGNVDPSRFQPLLEEISRSNLPENTLKHIRKQVSRLRETSEAGASLNDVSIERLVEVVAEDGATEELIVDELETLKQRVTELEAEVQSAKDALAAKDAELAALADEKSASVTAQAALEDELNSLRALKQELDAKAEREAKLNAIKERFTAAGLEKPDEYFANNAEHLLGLNEAGLDFMLQELVSFKEAAPETNGEASVKLPNLGGSARTSSDVSEIAKALRQRNSK